jgi:hypothetical protein
MNVEDESNQLNECCTHSLSALQYPPDSQFCNALLIPQGIALTCPALNKQKINLEAMSNQLVCIRNIDEQTRMPNILKSFQATSETISRMILNSQIIYTLKILYGINTV